MQILPASVKLPNIGAEAEGLMLREITSSLLTDRCGIENDDPMYDTYWDELMKVGKDVGDKSWPTCRSAMGVLAQRIREHEDQCAEDEYDDEEYKT